MNEFIPVEIKRPKPYLLKSRWKDGFEATIKLEDLRNECPSADSQEERKRNEGENFKFLNIMQPGRNKLVDLKPVGNYAVNAVWEDGHKTGIYPWELFRGIFEKYQLSDEQIEELEKADQKDD